MRPINLIPKDRRRGDAAPSRTGAAGWVIVAALALAVVGAVMLVTASNSISDKKFEVASLQHQEQEAQRRAAELAPYTAFQQTVAARRQTVAGLADSRFDWERVMRELALIVPKDIVISTLTATVKPGITISGATTIDLRGSVPGPALELTGCGTGPEDKSQEAIAGFISSLYDIDGVTRVGMKDSVVTREDDAAGADEKRAGACASGKQVSNFQIVVAFDSAPVPPTDGTIPQTPQPTPTANEAGTGTEGEAAQNGATGSTGATGATGSTGADGATGATGSTGANGTDGTSDNPTAAGAPDTSAQQSAAQATNKANKAVNNYIPGTSNKSSGANR